MSKGWNTEDIPDQTGKTVIVTGANSGIGLVAARELAGKGATVVVACRSTEKGEKAVEQMRGELAPNGGGAQFDVQALDLADLLSVRAFAETIKAAYPGGIDILINNAGVMASPRHETADGFELQFGTNHLGHFALTGLLFDELKKKPGARVVTLSSNGHKLGKLNFEDLQGKESYRRWGAYTQSKLANLVFALDLQTRIGEANLEMKSIGAHPGVSNTNLTAAGNDLGNSFFSVVSKPFLKLSDALLAQDAEHGALPTLYAATKPDLAGGTYIGPDGMGELRGSPTIVAPRKVAHNVEIADQLWNKSVELTGVEYDFGKPAVSTA
jgi:NAD(P)-dependent dehydrogenase (short-subunit alcohol dehydrogenase family)